jgi:transposase
VIGLAPGTKVFVACTPIDLRNGFDGLAAKVRDIIGADPFSGQLFIFRGKRGDYFKGLYWDGSGLWLFAKRLERGRFVWPQADSGKIHLTQAQLSMLLEGIDWRQPRRTAEPLSML